MSTLSQKRAAHSPVFSPNAWGVPNGWTWIIVRVIHCMPDDQVDGYRVVLAINDRPVIEVIHRDCEHARAIALDAAADMFPNQFTRRK